MTGSAASDRARRRAAAQAGFTLFELLVSITLLGLIALLLAGGLRFGTRVWEANLQRSEQSGEIQVVHAFLRRQIEQALNPLSLEDLEQDTRFEGSAQALRFTAPLMARAAPGGLQRLALARNEERQLVLSWRPFLAAEAFDAEARRWRDEILLEGVAELEFSYLASEAEDEVFEWRERWQDEEAPPAMVRLRLSFAEGDSRVWPELLASLRIEVAE